MAEYREIAASAAFAGSIECFWSLTIEAPAPAHRVTPDGCADLLFSQGKLAVVGAMTRYQDYAQSAGERVIGVRFRPAAWASHLGIPADRITDMILPLDDLWGARARALQGELASADALEQFAPLLERALRPQETTPIRRAIRWMEQHHGCVSIDEVADQTGLSPRQFRRLCLGQTGLSPKFLARVLRFRRAASLVRASACDAADLALTCGYYDQAHFINEFREFSGRTPSSFAA